MKAAVVHYTQGLAYQLAAKGIRANIVSPGQHLLPRRGVGRDRDGQPGPVRHGTGPQPDRADGARPRRSPTPSPSSPVRAQLHHRHQSGGRRRAHPRRPALSREPSSGTAATPVPGQRPRRTCDDTAGQVSTRCGPAGAVSGRIAVTDRTRRMVRRRPAWRAFLTVSPSTARPPRPSASPSARPRCSWQTVPGSSAATSANGQCLSTKLIRGPRSMRTGAEAAPGNICLHQVGRVIGTGQFGSAPVAFLPASLARVLLAPEAAEDTC